MVQSKRVWFSLLTLMSVGCAGVPGDVHGLDDVDVSAKADDDDVEIGMVAQAAITSSDVGVIKTEMPCPRDAATGISEEIMLGIDNENDNNNNSTIGWVGAASSGQNTYLRFCRVRGSQFKQVRSDRGSDTYAVLKLGTTCPTGSVELTRYFDNNDSCGNWLGSIGACRAYQDWYGNISPNSYGGNYGNNLTMKLCMFRASATAANFSFPALSTGYGVFGQGGLENGWIYTDDEDDNNHNSLTGSTAGSAAFLTAGSNTKLWFSRKR